MSSDWLDVRDGIAVGLATMTVAALIVFAAPAVLYGIFRGLYQFWQMVGVM